MKRIGLILIAMLSQNVYALDDIEEVVVTAHPLSEDGLSQSVKVLQGEELEQKVQASLGETVANEPGVRSASFGSAVGRPVIHGLGGSRVKTTEDQIDSLDVSVNSSDHAVTVEPFIANKINILKGASTLLYGNGAIGGVVDVDTGRIPTELPEEALTGRVETRFTDNASAKTTALRLDGKSKGSFAWHFDAFTKRADDYDIPSLAESLAQRNSEEEEGHDGHEDEHHDDENEHHEEEGEHHDEEEHEEGHEDEHHDEHEEENKGKLAGSRYKSDGGAFGFTWFGENGFVGASVSKTSSRYGLVGHHHHEDEHGEEDDHDEHADEDEHHEDEHGEEQPGMIDMKQTRLSLQAQLNSPFSGIEKVNLKAAVNDYEHIEIEGNGEIGTVFDNEAWEARVEMTHQSVANFEGVVGAQLSDRKFSAIGEEAFVPEVETKTKSLFWVGERDFESFDLEAGVRVDNVQHDLVGSAASIDFTSSSASLGLVVPLSEAVTVSGLFDFTSRAPTIEELFSNGAHLATQSVEIGDASLEEETATAFSVALSYESDAVNLDASVYQMSFDEFIYQANTGEFDDELPIREYRQHDATFTGLDLELGVHVASFAGGDVDIVGIFDTVKAELDIAGNQNLPRIPATRYGLGVEWDSTDWRIKLSYTQVADQDDVADGELATEGYDDVSLDVNRRIVVGSNDLDVFLQGRNLTDDEQRHHSSFVKDFAPAQGRRLTVGLRYKF